MTTPTDLIQSLQPNTTFALTRPEDGEPSYHRWSQAEIDALLLAAAAQRPLLIRGEPGSGKTQMARAIAQHLGWRLCAETIHPRYEPQDLVWRFDAVRRLADANAARAGGGQALNNADYWEPGPLWRAFDWASASQYGSCRDEARKGPPPAGHVILIDEIDKADSDLPNSLLEALGQRSFYIAGLGLKVGPLQGDAPRPLIMVTTNEERELPPAFLRRCVVLTIKPKADLLGWLTERGAAHFDTEDESSSRYMHPDVLIEAAQQLVEDRLSAEDAGLQPPGAAEYLDLLYALHRLAAKDKKRQLEMLDQLSRYAYIKHIVQGDGHPGLQQDRQPRARTADAAKADA